MMSRFLGPLALFLFMTPASLPLSAQAANHPPTGAEPATNATTQSPAVRPDCNGVPCDEAQPHIIVTLPQPAPTPWLLHDRIELGAKLALALLGYVAILIGISALRKMERSTRAAEDTAQAALETAQAALKSVQSVVSAERPWLLIRVEPSREKENTFTVMATNRGRTPACLMDSVDAIQFAADEASLPEVPAYPSGETAPRVPVILVPGESAHIKSFGRDQVEALCGSAERFKRIATWDEKIFLHGQIVYRDLIAPADQQTHTTNWCCWYIHGRQKSGLVVAGPAAYNAHT